MTAPCPRLGCIATIELLPSLDAAERGRFWNAWSALLAGRGLSDTETGGERARRVVTSDASQATEADRVALRAWLERSAVVKHWYVTELEDLHSIISG